MKKVITIIEVLLVSYFAWNFMAFINGETMHPVTVEAALFISFATFTTLLSNKIQKHFDL